RRPYALHVDLAHRNVQRVARRAEDVGIVAAPHVIRSALGARELVETGGILHMARRNAIVGAQRSDQVARDRPGLVTVGIESAHETAPAPARVVAVLRG